MSDSLDDRLSETIEIAPEWLAIEAVYGGRVASLVAGAAEALRPAFTPLSVTLEFLGSIRPGEAHLLAEPVHTGRQSGTVRVVLAQAHPKVVAYAKLLDVEPGPARVAATDLRGLPLPGSLVHRTLPYGRLPWEDQVELRLLDEPLRPEHAVRGWVRLVPGEWIEATELSVFRGAPLLLDVMPSALYGVEPAPVNVPTVEFTVHAAPGSVVVGEWYFVQQRLLWAGPNAAVEEATVHDADGAFVAAARQTRRVLRP